MYKKILNKQERLNILHSITQDPFNKLVQEIENKRRDVELLRFQVKYGRILNKFYKHFTHEELQDLIQHTSSIRGVISFDALRLPNLTVYQKKYQISYKEISRHDSIQLSKPIPILSDCSSLVLKGEELETPELTAAVNTFQLWLQSASQSYMDNFNNLNTILASTPKSEELLKLFPEIEKYLPKANQVKHLPIPYKDMTNLRLFISGKSAPVVVVPPPPKGSKARKQAATKKI